MFVGCGCWISVTIDSPPSKTIQIHSHETTTPNTIAYVASGNVLAEMAGGMRPERLRIYLGRLPIETKVIHGMYRGVFAMLDRPEPVPEENLVQCRCRRVALFFTIRVSELWERENR